MNIPQPVKEIYKILEKAGYDTYFVGGCVRNILLKKEVKDWDMTTNATPEQMMELFPDTFYDNQFGTVGVPFEEEETKGVVEITTFRSESGYSDRRHPEKVEWGKTIKEDLQRRDFTINAMAIQLSERGALQTDEIVDPFHGKEDLEHSIIRAVGNPNERFKEDALRLMRAIRFAAQLGFTIEEKTWESIQQDATLLPAISPERIHDELLKILESEYPYEGIMLLKKGKLLEYILPELLEGIGISQTRPGRHHIFDVFTHNILALKECPATNAVVRFATLIHDVGKPRVASQDQNGFVIFYNHEIVGSRMAYAICERLRFSKKDRDKIVKLIRWHMFTVDEHITDAAVRRFIRRIGVDNVKDMIDLRIGDRLGSGIPEERAESWRLKKFKARIEEQLQPGPFSIKDLAINGNDIMKELQMKPGPRIGEMLQKLFEEVDEDLHKNTRDYLLERVKELEI
ncbi:MAG TPA: CCA tRNA nucleotidyltransferase [Candidatus Saccharimonadales bacterium]|nr:CCA tRNA nucleotidyltransferase [Candidatus Saccharimonadales bacterium]